jgi:thiol-disulfide isomerase/thioredoxin
MKKFLSLLLIIAAFTGSAQKPLAIGDKLPDYKFQTLFNYSAPSFTLSQFKGKVVLINFIKWGCAHNYDIMPFLAAYQQKFKKDLEIIMVSDESEAIINSMFASRPGLKQLGLPLAKKDTTLQKLFPHASSPHMVIIGKDRLVKAIIQDKDLNDSILRLTIAGGAVTLPPPQIEKNLDKNTSLAFAGIANNNLIYNSILTGYANGIKAIFSIHSWPGNRLRLLMTNSNVKEMIITAWDPLVQINDLEHNLRIIWNVPDPLKYQGRRDIPGDENKLYCYELILPASGRSAGNAAAMAYVREDLERYFRLVATVEKRKMSSYVITPVSFPDSSNNKMAFKNGYVQQWIDNVEVHDLSFQSAAFALKPYLFMDKPLIVEGNSNQVFNFRVNKQYSDFKSMTDALYKTGLRLTVEARDIDCLVIKEKSK